MPGFLQRRQDDVASIRRALVSGEFEIVATIGHKLRGNGTTFGFPELSEIGSGLEMAARQSDHDAVLAWSDKLEKRVEELVLDLRAGVWSSR